VKKRIQTFGRFDPDTAANAAVAARRPTARYEFLTPKRRHAIAAVARFNSYFYSI